MRVRVGGGEMGGHLLTFLRACSIKAPTPCCSRAICQGFSESNAICKEGDSGEYQSLAARVLNAGFMHPNGEVNVMDMGWQLKEHGGLILLLDIFIVMLTCTVNKTMQSHNWLLFNT